MGINGPLTQARLGLFPATSALSNHAGVQELTIAGLSLASLAEDFGTPLYVYDQATMEAAVQEYRRVLAEAYPGQAGITYAGKAFLCLAIAQWVERQGLWLDCTGAGELAVARAASLPRQRVVVHGVSKSQVDLQAGLAQAGIIVVDHPAELEKLIRLLKPSPSPTPEIWLRLRPGIAVDTHTYRQTGQDDSKFGMAPTEVEQAVGRCLEEGLPLKGMHFHLGSHFHDPAPLGPAIETALDLIGHLRQGVGWTPEVFCVGGGWGVPYHEDDLPHQPVEAYVRFIAARLAEGCQRRDLPLPRLHLEPGRSLIAKAGVAIYQVISVKQTSHRRWILLDGGLADNPRPALYRARYSALPVRQPERAAAGNAWLGGPYCESGDILIEDLPMPEVQPGEYVAVPVSGAYQLSMGNNYNGARRPAVLWLSAGGADLIQRRETLEDLFRRDLPLPDPAGVETRGAGH